jgi:hypothetical protein
VIEWEEEGDRLVVRRAVKHSFTDIHRALFPEGPPRRRSVADMHDGIQAQVRKKHARR